MPDLGTIQLTIKFNIFWSNNSGLTLNLLLCPPEQDMAYAISCPRGVEISVLNHNAASLYAFTSLLPCLLATLWGWLLPTGVRWLSLNNTEKSKTLQNPIFVNFCCVASGGHIDRVGRSGLTNMKDTYM